MNSTRSFITAFYLRTSFIKTQFLKSMKKQTIKCHTKLHVYEEFEILKKITFKYYGKTLAEVAVARKSGCSHFEYSKTL